MQEVKVKPTGASLEELIFMSDPRLSLAQEVVSREFGRDGIEFSSLSIDQLANLVNRVQIGVARTLDVEEKEVRQVSPDRVSALLSFTASGESSLLVMRHGQQALSPDLIELNEADRKIAMMQHKHNVFDPLTSKSIAETCGSALVLRYVGEKTGKSLKVKTSGNIRSMQVAVIISKITGASFSFDNRLNCVDYPNKGKITIQQLALLYTKNGALVWEKEVVDAVCKEGTYERITEEMKNVISDGSTESGITVAVTHTQQLNAIDVVYHQAQKRLSELGFRAVSANQTQVFGNGVYT